MGKADDNTEAGRLVVPEHGRGKIWQGAPANPVAGPGRPPSKIKAALREDFDSRRHLLAGFADGDVSIRIREKCPECGHEPEPLSSQEIGKLIPSVAERIKALEVMAKFSDLESGRVDTAMVEELGKAVMAEIEDVEVVRRIHARWVEIIARRIAGD